MCFVRSQEYSTITTTTSPSPEYPVATSYSQVEQQGPKRSVPPPWERAQESSIYTSLNTEASSTISELATITVAPTTTTASLLIYNGTTAAELPVFTGVAARPVAVGGGVVGGVVAVMALL